MLFLQWWKFLPFHLLLQITNCMCIDSVILIDLGNMYTWFIYTSNYRCPTYTSLPVYCHLESVTGQCCKVVRCGPSNSVTTTMTTPSHGHTVAGCQDLVSDCASYGQSACTGTYKDWAQRNCPAFCNMCRKLSFLLPSHNCSVTLLNLKHV